ncbi:MAG TPA: winged helix DNA-binding protein [Polyangiaceae bacterium]|jgi:DNA-binding MarR family transcriptional regulator|nr:MAG: MarR family protein [Deltaproteobacteria bacterium ADurb.Bin207]HNS98240.1 winged helix DNA-binding protein [Polyangiaceae bacterium]HNZ25380.1 winged helix DNA-binding protein [Polyangiaceae bacterium]HOD24899.1 winged helix DNA-binding protein [Polyangiaceae bacterium]HOE51105.1 winged helix DNA-binding protein [Polyangiaceae bacterium]
MPRPESSPLCIAPHDVDIESQIERMGELVRRMLTSVRMPHDSSLTTSQLAVLCYLEKRAVRVGTLATAVGAAQNTTSEVVARLERVGLVRKEKDPEDQRAVLVSATERGLQALRERRAALRSVHRMILQALCVEDRKRFIDASEQLVELTEKARKAMAGTSILPRNGA